MNKLLVSIVLSAPMFLLSGCVVDAVTYDPGYSNDYVYSVGFYGNRPYWGNNYYYDNYPGFTVDGYWGSSDYFSGY